MESNTDVIEALEALKRAFSNVVDHLCSAISDSPTALVALQIPSDDVSQTVSKTIKKDGPSTTSDWIDEELKRLNSDAVSEFSDWIDLGNQRLERTTSTAPDWVDLPNDGSVWSESEEKDLIPPTSVKARVVSKVKDDPAIDWIQDPMGWLEREYYQQRLCPGTASYSLRPDESYAVRLDLAFSRHHPLTTEAWARKKKTAFRVAALRMVKDGQDQR